MPFPVRLAYLPAVLAVVVIIAVGFYAGQLNRELHGQTQRAEVLYKINLIRAKLEGDLNANVQLVRGLVATIVSEPNMSPERFEVLARSLLREQTQLRNVAAAPDFVVTMVYPLAGNEGALGLDYRIDDAQREAAFRARDTRQIVLAGPVDLRQGGQGFIGRYPVYVTRDGRETFWGIVSVVIDLGRLYRDSGLVQEDLGLDLALIGKDGKGEAGELFFGDASIVDADPVHADILLPAGTWRLYATPKGGWSALAPNTRLFRFTILFALVLVVGPILVAGRLFRDRQRNFQALAEREEELSLVSERLRLACDASHIGVWEHDLSTNRLVWDDRLNEMYGRTSSAPGQFHEDWANSIHPDDLDRAMLEFEQAVESRSPYSSEYRIKLADGTVKHMRAKAVLYVDPSGAQKLIGAEWDVTEDVELREALERSRFMAELKNAELEAAKARIEHNALHDSLTGLPNRRYLDLRIEAAAKDPGKGAALLHLDLDRFKQINDTLGHAAGDAMLVHVAKVLADTVGEGDFVARIGGDEFVVLSSSMLGQASLSALAATIVAKLRQPVPYEGHMCRFGVSVGVAVETGAEADPKRLLVNADIALYRAKRNGRSRFEFFTDCLQAEIVGTKRMADEILGALEREEFVTHYQPQFDALTQEIVGVEALVRWQHPVRGMLLPGAFLKTAEELNVVSAIDSIVLEQALADFRNWQAMGLNIPRISVNVSARRLQDGELMSSLRSLDIPRGVLSFELVESIFFDENDDLIVWNVNHIKELGIDIEIDDFGTGYASIVSLQKLRPRRLKIDRQLVMPIVANRRQRRLLESIVEIGKSLDIEVIAEGVETMEHARLLAESGCDALQGYAFAKPMSSADLVRFAGRHGMRKAS